jgi:hypothetical protein
MVRLIADCDRLATTLDKEVRTEEHRVKKGPKDIAYCVRSQAR